jgi:copper(I)-binding protein
VIRIRRGAPPLRGLVVVAAAALIPAIAGCEAGAQAPTQQWHQPTPGASAVVGGTLRINNMFVLGPVPGSALPHGGSAGLFFALANAGGPDRLLSIAAPGSAASVRVPAGGITVGRQQLLLLSGPAPRVLLEHLVRALRGGQVVQVTMNFQNAGHVSLRVPVMPRAAYYSTFSPAPVFQSPSATVSPLPQPSPTPTG